MASSLLETELPMIHWLSQHVASAENPRAQEGCLKLLITVCVRVGQDTKEREHSYYFSCA